MDQLPASSAPRFARRRVFVPTAWIAGAVLWGLGALPALAVQNCQRSAGPQPLAVVELYTSEGCSSCPPADQWLSALKPQDGVLALAFHVNYWDHLGWLDRFATPQTTARQHQIMAALRSAYVYTPQVVLNGQDYRAWRGKSAANLPGLPAAPAPELRLSRDGEEITAQIGASGAHQTLAGFWAVLSDGLSSKVTRGENAGEVLHHNHVVSHYQPVAPWTATKALTLRLRWPAHEEQRVAFVVTDGTGTRPVQALDLKCSR